MDANGNFVLGTSDTATGAGVFVHYSGEKSMRALLPLTPGLWSWYSPAPMGVINRDNNRPATLPIGNAGPLP